MTTDVDVRWMSFQGQGHADEILGLRRRVFFDEQGFGPDMVSTPYDPEGLHLGLFQQGKLVSAVCAYVFDDKPEIASQFQLPPGSRAVQIGKRAALPEMRQSKLNEALIASMGRAIYETLRPDVLFFALRGVHRKFASYFIDLFGFQAHATVTLDGVEMDVLTITGEDALRASYPTMRKLSETGSQQFGLPVPSLVRHLERTERAHLIALDKLKQDNLYIEPLSLRDELPRLSAQTRVLHSEQRARIHEVDFPSPPARLLDIGAGPGVYLSMLTREPKLRGYEFAGLDASAEMVLYARLNRPDLRWIQASVYDTGEPAESYDVVHANFLFIHLLNPALALREVHRILKPGGIFYLFEVNDGSLEAPPAMTELVESHYQLHLGNRKIMSTLPGIAEEHGFELVRRFSTRGYNDGTQQDPTVGEDEMHLNRTTMWGLFAFLGQREELAEQFSAAKELYFNSNCDVSICVETHVYRKVR